MPKREKDRKRQRRQRRVAKLRNLKKKLAEANDPKMKDDLIRRIRRIDPWAEIPDA